jgi:tol-pal system protein YbgF
MLNRVAVAASSSMRAVCVGLKPLGVLVLGASLGLSTGFLATVTAAHAQAGADLLYRIERLENQIRQMTGDIEQLQYRNQQLEAALSEMRYQDPGARGGARVAAAPPMQPAPGTSGGGRRGDAFDPSENPYAPGSPRTLGATPGQPAPTGASGAGGRRGGDAFDPSQNPYAPGAPRTLGVTPPQPPPPNTRPGMGPTPYAAGASGGADQDYGRPPPAPPPGGGGAASAFPAVATTSPPPSGSGSPREVYDAGVAYLQRRDYAAAEESFRDFLRRYPTDRMAAEAQFNLGESLYQRQSYQEAADAFLQMTKKYENNAKAPDAMLRLGQSLAALNDKELACVAFADVNRKYPRARSDVKQATERELKRARCS